MISFRIPPAMKPKPSYKVYVLNKQNGWTATDIVAQRKGVAIWLARQKGYTQRLKAARV